MAKAKKATAPEEKKVIKERKYTWVELHYEDGTSQLTRTNDGFGIFELLGMIRLVDEDLISQIKGYIKHTPDIIKRQVVVDSEKNQ